VCAPQALHLDRPVPTTRRDSARPGAGDPALLPAVERGLTSGTDMPISGGTDCLCQPIRVLRRENIVDMRRLAIAVSTVLPLILLAGCGGSSHPAHRSSATTQPSTTSTSTVPASTTAPTTTSTVGSGVSFPLAIYPPARAPAAADEASCPGLAGLIEHPSATPATFVPLINNLAHAASLSVRLTYFDQALWPDAKSSWSFGHTTNESSYSESDLQAFPAWESSFTLGSSIANSCGNAVLDASWIVSYCFPDTPFSTCVTKDPALTGTTAYIERNGTWLVWYENGGYQGS